ncbi:winged helix-turn-helix domain-containing protein [Vibrio azureus]|nr:winged helix-turn-helix domain-containing protein [Vibrio azureus]
MIAQEKWNCFDIKVSFVDVKFDIGESSVTYRDKKTSLQANELNLALLLLKNHGEMVTKDEIFREVWKNKVVTEGSIKRSISLLRKALSEVEVEVEIKAHRGLGYSINTPLNVFLDNQVALLTPSESSEDSESNSAFFWAKSSLLCITLIISNLIFSSYLVYEKYLKYEAFRGEDYFSSGFISFKYRKSHITSDHQASVTLITNKKNTIPVYLSKLLTMLNQDMVIFYQVNDSRIYFSYSLEKSVGILYSNNYILPRGTEVEKIKEILSPFQ